MRENRWLHQWVDECGVETPADADAALRSPASWARLLELAAAHDAEPTVAALGKRSISAGRSMDLTAFLACGHVDCLTAQVDNLFSRVWHYFDKIAVVGADAHLVLEMAASDRPERARALMAGMVRVILHARETGAERFLVFADKPPACPQHWPEFYEDSTLQIPQEALNAITQDLLLTGKVSFRKGHCAKCGDRFEYQGRALPEGRSSVSQKRVLDNRPPGMAMDEAVVRTVLDKYVLGAASDLVASEELAVPIGAGIPLEARLLSALRPTHTEAEVAFHLQLPVVEGLGVKDLLALREAEGDAFDAFRVALNQAMSERLKEDGSKDPAKIASEIEDELLEPTLVDLRSRLAAAEKALGRKHLVHASLAGLATVCGLLGEPTVATGLLAGAATSATKAEFDAIEKRGEVESNNMYFLWKVDHAVREQKASQKASRKSNRKRK